MRSRVLKSYAALLLTALLTAYVGQKVHIFLEDPAHFAAHCGGLLSDNGAAESVADKCIVDDFILFTFAGELLCTPAFYLEQLAVLHPDSTSCVICPTELSALLRAPPVA